MKKFFINFAAFISTALVTGCDDGRIYPDDNPVTEHEGRVAKLTGTITGQDTWADGYEVVVAAFDGSSDYALTAKNIPAGEHSVSTTMTAIPDGAKTVELCVINRLRRRVATIKRADINAATGPNDTIFIDAGTVDAGMLTAIQDNVLTPRCATCHGGSSTAAAGIHLTAGSTYGNIVGKASRRVEGKSIVEPANSAESVLNMMLNTGISASWGYDHGNADLSDEWKKIITLWIDNGARR